MSGKGSSPRPYSVPKESFDQSFERIFGITCKRCGKRGLQPDGIHTCSSKEVREQIEGQCSDHPDAPHGFDRNASHNAERYVCECEGWEP